MNVTRRNMIVLAGGSMALAMMLGKSVAAGVSFDSVLDAFQQDEADFPGASASVELKEVAALYPQVAVAGTSDGVGSKTPIAAEAERMIAMFEVTSRNTYQKRYRGPIWPKGASGVTIGIGYDIGYVRKNRFRAEWKDFISDADIKNLERACGVKSQDAKALLKTLDPFAVDYDIAYKQFKEVTLPLYVADLENTVVKTSALRPEERGALVSLIYNRGCSWQISESKDPSGRFKEMRAIKAAVQSGDFAEVPKQMRAMKRLWAGNPDMRGLLTRRELEAALFESAGR